ncbi:hypothetical protein [Nocardioides massiliensis]|uniref:Uncharacterized protein n=1 Tax=Nocardioides massiliensis TaxID=1325935 RepID=A0ABT9NJC0_9ACTN|nr:hypothetical protein [Nocardioides massiliensis]MDP9820519.1 hypothetical protein [Nocardioides massiliensis]
MTDDLLRGWRQLAIALLRKAGGSVVMRGDDALDIDPDDYMVQVTEHPTRDFVSVRLVGDGDE